MTNVKEHKSQPQPAMLGQPSTPNFASVSRSTAQPHQFTDPLLLPEAVASILCTTIQTLAVWRCTGRYDLHFLKIGSKVLYRQSDVQAFIESCVVGK